MVTSATIANASEGELLCITYELLLEVLDNADKGIEKQKNINKAIQIIKYLAETLDMEQSISKDLFRVYAYMQGLLINEKYNQANIEEVYSLVNTIYVGYKQAVKDEEPRGAMENTQSIYAGVTYGKNTLNEMVMESNNRGFQA